MNLRRFFSRDLPESGMAPAGIPTWIVESDRHVRERLFVERVTRYVRLATWLTVLSTAILFLSIAVSVASIQFGTSPLDGGNELFAGASADPVDRPPDVAP